MSQVITIKIKKKTLWISLIVFIAVVGSFLFWFVSRRVEKWEKFERRREEHERQLEKSKEYAMRQHINHVDKGLKYDKTCSMCNGAW